MISIILNAFNEGIHLQKTVDSILKAVVDQEFEIVFVDDGSTDDSFQFLEQTPYQQDVRLRPPYRFEASVGLIRARHQGVRLARGSHFFILDAHMCVHDGWLDTMAQSAERLGPRSIIMPSLTGLDVETWLPHAPFDSYITIDAKFDFEWRALHYPTRLLATVSGGCYMMSRAFYFEIGGFDLGLIRWGCENIDIVLKCYAAGGVCFFEPEVLIGHLFRTGFPYEHKWWHLHYNKLRVAYVHFPEGSFRRFVDGLYGAAGFSDAWQRFKHDLSELQLLKAQQALRNVRSEHWFISTFLPQLMGSEPKARQSKSPLPFSAAIRPHTRISIVMAATEEPDMLQGAVDDLLSHTHHEDYELLILSRAEEERDYGFLNSAVYASRPNLRHHRVSGAFTRAALHNGGAELATGTLLKFVTARSRFTPYWLSNLQGGWFRTRGLVGGIISNYDLFESRMSDVLTYGWQETAEKVLIPLLERDVSEYGSVSALSTSQMMVPASLFQALGGFYPGFSSEQNPGFVLSQWAKRLGFGCHLIPETLLGQVPVEPFLTGDEVACDHLAQTYLLSSPEAAEELKRAYLRDICDLSAFESQRPMLRSYRQRFLSFEKSQSSSLKREY